MVLRKQSTIPSYLIPLSASYLLTAWVCSRAFTLSTGAIEVLAIMADTPAAKKSNKNYIQYL